MMLKNQMKEWVNAFNEKNARALSEMYHEDAMNFQVATDIQRNGRDEIFKMFEYEFENFEMVCIPQRIVTEGNTVVLEWKDPNGLEGCGFFTFEGTLIKSQKGYWDRWSFEQKQGKDYN